MKVCFVIHSLNAGGAERVISDLANHFSQQPGYECHLITFQPEGTPSFYPLNSNVILHQLGLKRGRSIGAKILSVLKMMGRLRAYLKNLDFNAVISFVDEMNLSVLLASLGLHKRIFISERIDPRYHPLPWYSQFLRRILYPRATALIVQGAYIASFFSYMRSKVKVIPNPIHVLSTQNPNPSMEKIILSVGRLSPQKDQATLLCAFSRIHDEHADWVFHIYGQGPLESDLKALSQSLGIADKVFIFPPFSPIQQKMKDASLFVFPSLYEGFPNALGEAMAMGLPVIASSCEGNIELVNHGKNGLIFTKGDVYELSAHLQTLIQCEDLRNSLGDSARFSLSQFKPEAIYAQWTQMIEGTCAP